MSDLVKRGKKVLTPALAFDTQVVAVKAEGCWVEGDDGKKYLDFSCGTVVTNIGHRPPRVVKAAQAQLERFIHAGCVFYYDSVVKLFEELTRITPGDIDMFFVANAGVEAVEGSLKLARWVTRRGGIICFRGAFHGRTLGAISITSSRVHYRKRYEPLLPSVYRTPYPYCYRCPMGQKEGKCSLECFQYLETMMDQDIPTTDIGAVIMEPILGEGGYVVPPKSYMERLRELCDRHEFLLIFDEIQSGMGRAGKWFACEHFGVVPDIICIAKGIASGFPLSAFGASKKLMQDWPPGAHGTTFGGNPISCAAAVATIETIREDKLLEKCQELSPWIIEKLKKLQEKYPVIGDIRGLGYMIGIELVHEDKKPAPELTSRLLKLCLEEGLILIGCGTWSNVIRFIPPLIVTREELEKGLTILDKAFQRLS